MGGRKRGQGEIEPAAAFAFCRSSPSLGGGLVGFGDIAPDGCLDKGCASAEISAPEGCARHSVASPGGVPSAPEYTRMSRLPRSPLLRGADIKWRACAAQSATGSSLKIIRWKNSRCGGRRVLPAGLLHWVYGARQPLNGIAVLAEGDMRRLPRNGLRFSPFPVNLAKAGFPCQVLLIVFCGGFHAVFRGTYLGKFLY